jgi:hypothetical protein
MKTAINQVAFVVNRIFIHAPHAKILATGRNLPIPSSIAFTASSAFAYSPMQ